MKNLLLTYIIIHTLAQQHNSIDTPCYVPTKILLAIKPSTNIQKRGSKVNIQKYIHYGQFH